MNSNPHNSMATDSGVECGEDTLRLIAGLPAPAGLEERVHKALRVTPSNGRVLAWPSAVRLESNWMRAAAAAAIVFVVVGGGWGVYTRVEPGQTGKVIVMPQRAPSSSRFSGAGAMRTPQTLPGPEIRDRGTKGTREQGTQPAKRASALKKHGAQPSASQPTPKPAVSRSSATRPSSQP